MTPQQQALRILANMGDQDAIEELKRQETQPFRTAWGRFVLASTGTDRIEQEVTDNDA